MIRHCANKCNLLIGVPILEIRFSRMAAPPHIYRFPFARTDGFQSSGQVVSPHWYIHRAGGKKLPEILTYLDLKKNIHKLHVFITLNSPDNTLYS